MQSNAAKVGVAVVSVAAIVVLFVVFSGSDDDDGGESTQAAEVTETTTEAPANDAGAIDGAEGKDPAKPDEPEPVFTTIVTVGGTPKDGVADLEYEKGDRVRIEVKSDVPEEIHVHGYDIYEDVPAGGKGRVSFPAEIDGVFEIELHGTGAQIAQLTVKP